jgi:hypothetical protein
MWNPTGMINQVMSLELAIGLAYETKRNVIVYNVSQKDDDHTYNTSVPIYSPSRDYNDQRFHLMNQTKFPSIFDLMNWDQDIVLIGNDIKNFLQEDEIIKPLAADYYYSKETEISDLEKAFADGRKKLILPENKNVNMKFTLGWYSRFFFNRSKELDKTLSSIVFKDEYIDLANKIVKSLGNFQGGHLRLSDHKQRMFEVTEKMFEDGLLEFEKNDLKIVISTDDPNDPIVQKNKHRFILLDEYIINNFYEDFKKLPFTDEVVFGLICLLVMENAKFFIGTSGSTYTAYIHRKRNQLGIETWNFFDNPKDTSVGPFSWNNYNLEGHQKMFWREWRESKLDL